MGNKIVSKGSMIGMILCMAILVIINNQSVASADSPLPTPIYASEDTTIVYEGLNANLIYEDGDLGYLDVGYQGIYSNPTEVQVLLKFDLPTIPQGYEIETANLYIPVSGGELQETTDFSLKVATSTDHSWIQDSNIIFPPAPTPGSTRSRVLASTVPIDKPLLAPFTFTSYILEEYTKTDPKATFILSGMTAREADNSGINFLNHYIRMTETSTGSGTLGPYLIFTYSQILDIEITGVVNGGNYNTNVTPQFNVGSATLNGSPFTSGTQVTAEGSYTLTVTAGSQLKTIQFRIDKTSPTAEVIINLGNQYTNSSSVPISINPDPGVTDITHIESSINGSPYTRMPYVPSFNLSIGSTDGDKVLRFKLVDRAGNQSIVYQSTITRDTEPPTGTVTINEGAVYATNQEVTLDLSLGSGVTDVVAVQFSNNRSSWTVVEAFSPSKSYTLTAGDGTKTVYARLIDRAGNVTIIQASIILDTTAPTGTLTLLTPSITNKTTVSFVVKSSDSNYMELGEIGEAYSNPVAYSESPQSYALQDTEEDGVKALQVRLSDLAGNTTVLTIDVTLDRIAPTGTMIVNSSDAYTNDSDVAVEVTPTAGVTDIASIRYSINGGAPTTIAYTSSFQIDVGSTDGPKEIKLRLIDHAGNESPVYSSTVTLDTEPPTGTVAINEGAAYATDQEVTLDFTLGAGVTDVVSVQFSNDNLSWSSEQAYSASMSYMLPTGDGSKTVYVRFIDRAGNIGTAQASIILDTTAPTGTLTLLTPSITNETTVSFVVKSSDSNYMELGEIGEAYSNPVAYSESPQSYALQDTEEDGVKTLQVRLSDLAGNTTVLTIDVTLDRIAPTGTVIVNNSDAYTNDSDVAVEVTPTAGVTDIASIRYSLNGGAATTIAYTSSFQIDVGSTDGPKEITLRLIDHAGNESPVYSSTVTLDTEPPTGTVAINEGAVYATNQEVTLDFTLGAGVTDVVSVQFSNDNLSWSSEQAYSASMSYMLPTGDGSKTVYVRFIDQAGNIGTAQASIILDTTAPTGTVAINEGAAYATAQEVTLDFTLGAGVTDVVSVQLSNDNLSWSSKQAYSASMSYMLPTGDGSKTVYVRFIDRAGNIGAAQASIILDTEPPTGTVTINKGATYATDQEVTLDFTLGAGVTDVVSVQFSNDNLSWSSEQAYSASMSYMLPTGDGSKTVYVRFIDRAGNIGTAQASIMLDTTAPTGTVTINEGAAYATDQEVTLDFTLGAGVTDVVSVQFSNDNLSWSSKQAYSASMSYMLPTGDGSKTVYVRFIDQAGNIGTAQASIILDTTAPIVTGVTDGESYNTLRTITFNEGTATLNGNVVTSGLTVEDEGGYVLVVTDEAGNSITIAFSIFKYRVSYDGNGAIGGLAPVDSQTYETGNTASVIDHIGSLVKIGSTLVAWNTEADGSGTSYVANDTFTISTANVTLYAIWELNHYTLSFESNGGSVVADKTKPYNELATEPDAPTKSGFAFGGWFKNITLTTPWNFTNDRLTENATLYAKWNPNHSSGSYASSPMVSFEINGGNDISNLLVVIGSNLSELPTPTKEGFIFEGWYHDKALTHKWDYETDRVTTNITLYAKWMEVITPEPKPAVDFKDISGHWAQEMIEKLASQGIITGYADGSFKPNESIQRQHMALIFMRAFELKPVRELTTFSDVSPNHANYEAIALLQQAGIVDGTNGRFHPSEPVTRAQMAKIVALALKIELGGTSPFKDVPSTHWSYAYVAALAERGIIVGDNGKFNPDEAVTRAQFVAMMYRALNLNEVNEQQT